MIGPFEYNYDSDTDAVVSVTFAKPGKGFHWAVHEVLATYNGAVASADVTIVGLENTWAHNIEVPASDKGLKGFVYRPAGVLVGQENTEVVVSLPAGGAAVVGTLGVVCRKVLTASL